MTASTEKMNGELSRFLNSTSPEDLHRPAMALAHIREMVGRASLGIPVDSNPLIPLGIGLERIELEAKNARAVETFLVAGLTGLELGVTVSAALLHRPEWETVLGAATTLTIMALTQPGLEWKENRRIRGGLENLLMIGRFADLVASVQPELSRENVAFEPSGDVPASGL